MARRPLVGIVSEFDRNEGVIEIYNNNIEESMKNCAFGED
jgi:hypothetical protein